MYDQTYDYKLSDLLSTDKAAELLNLSPDTLAIWRSTKRYNLRYVKIGRKVFYQYSDIMYFIQSRTVEAAQ